MSIFIFSLFILWRMLLFISAWFGGKILDFSPRFPYADIFLIPSGLPAWLWGFANFDGVHYLTIAVNGYTAQYTQVFFPLFPLLLGLVHNAVNFLNPVLVGLFVSNAFFLLGLFVYRRLLRLDYRTDTIKWVLIITISFPASFYLGSVYTESFFFFLIISSFYMARKKRWLISSILGVLASSTKLIGIFLIPSLLIEWVSAENKVTKFPANRKDMDQPNNFLEYFCTPISIIPAGLLSYMLYLQLKFGDYLYFWHAQPVFGAERSGSGIIFLPQVVWRYFKILTTLPMSAETYWISLLEISSTFMAFILLYMAYKRKVRLSYIIFSLLAIITPTFTGTLSSMTRYVWIAFPMFILLGMIKSRLFKSILIFVFTVLLITLTILFTRGHWVA